MRITQNLTFNNLERHLNRNREELAKFQQQLSSGKQVTKASDGNVAFTTSRLIDEAIRKNEQYQSNINTGMSQARTAQESLDSMIDVLIEFKSMAINGASDSLTADDRTALANRVESLREKMTDLSNARFNETYLFGGTNTLQAPFSADVASPGGVKDTSTNNPLKIRVSDNAQIETTVNGSELRTTSAGDLFGIMKDVEDALRANDRAAVNGSLDNVEATITHVTGLASRIGNNINRLDFVNEQLESKVISQKGEVSRLTDTDFAQAISNYKKFETSYDAALAVHAKMTQTSLLNYLR